MGAEGRRRPTHNCSEANSSLESKTASVECALESSVSESQRQALPRRKHKTIRLPAPLFGSSAAALYDLICKSCLLSASSMPECDGTGMCIAWQSPNRESRTSPANLPHIWPLGATSVR